VSSNNVDLIIAVASVQDSYRNTVLNGDWHRKLEFPNGDLVVIHSPAVILHMIGQPQGVSWASSGLEVSSSECRFLSELL